MRNNVINIPSHISNFVVGTFSVDTDCSFFSIQAAINAAAPLASDTSQVNIFIKPGVYTENLTFSEGINLIAFEDSEDNGIIIAGHHSIDFTAATAQRLLSFQGIYFFIDGASTSPLFTFTSSTQTDASVSFFNCQLKNSVAINQQIFNIQAGGSLTSFRIFLRDCFIDWGNIGDFYTSQVQGVTIGCDNCNFRLPSINSTTSSGSIDFNFKNCSITSSLSPPILIQTNSEIGSMVFSNCNLVGKLLISAQASPPAVYKFFNCTIDQCDVTGSDTTPIYFVKCNFTNSEMTNNRNGLGNALSSSYIDQCFCIPSSSAGNVVKLNRIAYVDLTVNNTKFTSTMLFSHEFNLTTNSNSITEAYLIPINTVTAVTLNVSGRVESSTDAQGTAGYGTFGYYVGNTIAQLYFDNNISSDGGSSVSLDASSGLGIGIEFTPNALVPGEPYHWSSTVSWLRFLNHN